MGRTVAVIWHASFSIVAAGLYFFFVLPRWPELVGQTSPTLGLILRIVTGVLIGLAALPVVFTLQRSRRPELATPLLALRLRGTSIALHVLAAVLIVGAAISEIWLSLDTAGQWLFGIYGAAAAIALLGIFGFYLAFAAEMTPPPPKPLKVRDKTNRRGRKAAEEPEPEVADEPGETEASEETDETEAADDAAEAEAVEAAEAPEEVEATEEAEVGEPASASLRNRRPSTKSGSRRGWRKRGEASAED